MMVAQNKWRATRFGAAATLVDSDDYTQHSVQETIDRLVTRLLPVAGELGCAAELSFCRELPKLSGAEQQLQLYRETYSRHAVVQRMLEAHEWRPQ
jgi:carboxylate-amine ligase